MNDQAIKIDGQFVQIGNAFQGVHNRLSETVVCDQWKLLNNEVSDVYDWLKKSEANIQHFESLISMVHVNHKETEQKNQKTIRDMQQLLHHVSESATQTAQAQGERLSKIEQAIQNIANSSPSSSRMDQLKIQEQFAQQQGIWEMHFNKLAERINTLELRPLHIENQQTSVQVANLEARMGQMNELLETQRKQIPQLTNNLSSLADAITHVTNTYQSGMVGDVTERVGYLHSEVSQIKNSLNTLEWTINNLAQMLTKMQETGGMTSQEKKKKNGGKVNSFGGRQKSEGRSAEAASCTAGRAC
jgi:chromosome segregation ATPase